LLAALLPPLDPAAKTIASASPTAARPRRGHRHVLQQHHLPEQRPGRGGADPAGFTDVRKYAGGIQDCVEAGLPTETGVPARS
jgi:hypothetical protein